MNPEIGASYHYQAPVSLCAGKEVTTNFVYGESAVKFINLTVINWTVRKTKQDTAEIFSYYNKAAGFKIRPGIGDRFKNKVTWVPNTINLKFGDLTANETGFYDVAITIFGAGKEETKDTNATFQLTVKDPCLMAKVIDESACTMLNCSSMENNQVYSWTGKDAEGETVRSIEVCPKEETNYTCCVDAMKTKCSSFTAQAGEFQTTEDNKREFQTTEVNNQKMDNKNQTMDHKNQTMDNKNQTMDNKNQTMDHKTKDNGKKDGGNSNVVGIVVGVLVVLVVVGIIIAVIYIRKRRGDGGYFAASSN
ncbi:Hypothetical predicted protein [Mytilus galloprovincialis]|uniref:Ig-like domain-containing protein n=1 Tax=Mytilus galloprovincialis TaxID=29158 RepID=A0A8B6F7C7_MYTGA|nr:Hypothetical predicted protein [Mytilus galloprovincialis]